MGFVAHCEGCGHIVRALAPDYCDTCVESMRAELKRWARAWGSLYAEVEALEAAGLYPSFALLIKSMDLYDPRNRAPKPVAELPQLEPDIPRDLLDDEG